VPAAPRDTDAAGHHRDPDPLRLLSSTCNLSVREPERLRRQFETVSLLGPQARTFNVRLPIGGDRALAGAHPRAGEATPSQSRRASS
jgi:hypothetical protein